MKRKTLLLAFLALTAGVLSVLISATHVVLAEEGSVQGGVYWIDQYGNMRPMAWAQVTAEGTSERVVAYTTDGSYVMWLPEGTYDITASSDPGFYPASATNIVVSPGSSTSIDFTLEPTGEPIPELPPWSQPLVVLGTLVMTVLVVRRYRARSKA